MAVIGLKAIVKNMSSFDRKTVRRLVNAVQATQATVVNSATSIVPVRTTALLISIQPGRVVITDRSVEGEVTAGVEYASFAELGTSKQRPQPYLAPSLLRNQASFRRLVQRAISA